MTIFVRAWNASYEASPADSQNASQGATRIREVKEDVAARLVVDHSWVGDVDDGMHKQVTFVDPLAAKPTQLNEESYLYAKDISGTSELFYEDEAGNEVQLTSAGDLYGFPSGTLMLFQQTTAPVGWTKQTTHNDKALRVVSGAASSGGSSSFSTVFGKIKTNDHTLLVAELPAHAHGSAGAHTHSWWHSNNTAGSYRGGLQDRSTSVGANETPTNMSSSGAHTHSSVGSNLGHFHNMDIRVQYVDFIIASKD